MKTVFIRNISEDKYWKWKEVKNKLRAEDWEEMVDTLIEVWEEGGESE